MKKSGLLILSLFILLFIGFQNLSASNAQEYKMNKALCEKYIKLSREAMDEDNVPLAQAYAKKAVQANSWDKLAWANYNDIVQRLADDGEIPEYGTVVEESKADEGPSADTGPVQLEGC